ncbi:MAG: hypothetical protein AAF696_11405 [Bacteroidota bacterium]
MKTLRKLSSAEVALLRDHKSYELIDFLWLTLSDLLLKGVLNIEHLSQKAHLADAAYLEFVIMPGRNFQLYNAAPHEILFTLDFMGEVGQKLSLRQLWTRVLQRAIDKRQYLRSYLLLAPNMRLCFERDFLFEMTGRLKMSDLGKETQLKIAQELTDVEIDLWAQLNYEADEAIKSFLLLKGNFQFLRNVSLATLSEFEKALFIQSMIATGQNDLSESSIWIDSFLQEHFEKFVQDIHTSILRYQVN